MNTAAVICEFNPFHNGHEYLLKTIRQQGADHIVVCMSGSFTQRGEAAMFDKMTRTRAALIGGADLVIELPVSYACSGAESFAFGGVYLLEQLHCVDRLYFGSECGDTALLKLAATAVTSPKVQQELKSNLQRGMTFAAARQNAVRSVAGSDVAAVLSTPNDILGVEYIKALHRLSSPILPCGIQRKGADHHSTAVNGTYAGGSLIRKMLLQGEDSCRTLIPEKIWELYQKNPHMPPPEGREARLMPLLLYRLRTMDEEDFACLPEISEGLEHRIYTAVRESTSVEELIDRVKTKRYPYARIRRILNAALLHLRAEDIKINPAYIRVLGLNHRGREILKIAGQTAGLPLLLRHADLRSCPEEAVQMYERECRADDIFALSDNTISLCGSTMREPIIILNE